MPNNPPSVSLILGSGGARGLVHIGVIRWLEEHHFRIASIAGSSMGALIGGVYAAGKLDQVEQWLCSINKVDIVGLMDFSWDGGGLVKGDKVINALVELVGDQRIEDLPIKFTAVATDIDREREVWLNSGRLFDAIRASISMPLFFTPFASQGSQLIDGGVLNPVPMAPTFGDRTDISIAVNLGGPAEVEEPLVPVIPVPKVEKTSNIRNKILSFLERFHAEQEQEEETWGAYDVASKAIELMQSTIARQKLAVYPPDYLIEIPFGACGVMEFHRAPEMIELGYRKAEARLASLLQNH